ncbi:MAG: ABC transporter ATP-binding protein [Burkholderiaceae bacterium]
MSSTSIDQAGRANADQALLEYRQVGKAFVSDHVRTQALRGIDFAVRRGEFVSVVGPSGCGKSTLLNLAAGLMRPSSGQVRYGGEPVRGINQRVGYITQRDNLLPWATVYDNIVLGLKIRGVPRAEQRELADRFVRMVGLKDFVRHYPSELSGGMRKRVSLARTLIYSPEMVLMDEPFSALDAHVKLVMQAELLRIWEADRKTILFITHDLTEAITLSDRVVILSARPATVKLVVDINLPRPRDAFALQASPEFQALFATLWNALKSDLSAHVIG